MGVSDKFKILSQRRFQQRNLSIKFSSMRLINGQAFYYILFLFYLITKSEDRVLGDGVS